MKCLSSIQVHTTGMDIKQAPNARAIVTIGKVRVGGGLHVVGHDLYV